jgi:hypothetical protein
MMGTAHSGRGFRGVLNYVLDEKDGKEPEIIGGSMDGTTARELAAEFAYTRDLKPDIAQPVHHLTLSADAYETVGNEKWVAICGDHLRKLGYDLDKTQWVAMRHHDTECDRWTRTLKVTVDGEDKQVRETVFEEPEDERLWKFHPAKEHIHIVASRIQTNGKLVSNHNDRYKVMDSCREIELTHGLNQVEQDGIRTLTNSEKKQVEETKQFPPKTLIQAAILEAAASREIQPFVQKLEQRGVKLHPNLASTGRFNGFTYELQGQRFSGQQLGNTFKWTKLGVSYEPDRDRAFIESRRSNGLPRAAERDPQRQPEVRPDEQAAAVAQRIRERGAASRSIEPASGPISGVGQDHSGSLRDNVQGDGNAVDRDDGEGQRRGPSPGERDRRSQESAAAAMGEPRGALAGAGLRNSDQRSADGLLPATQDRRPAGNAGERAAADIGGEGASAGREAASTPPYADGVDEQLSAERSHRRLLDIAAAIERDGKARVSPTGIRVLADSHYTPTSDKHLHGDGFMPGSRYIQNISSAGNVQPLGELAEIHVGGTQGNLEYTLVAKKGRQRELAAQIREDANDQLKWDQMVERHRARPKSRPQTDEHEQEQTKGHTRSSKGCDGPER